MNDLVASAAGLVAENEVASRELDALAGTIASELSGRLIQRPDLAEHIGPDNFSLMDANHENHFRYVASTAAVFDPTSFVEIVIWVLRTYRGKGFSLSYWNVMLPQAKALSAEKLTPESYQTFEPIYDWLQDNLDALAAASEVEHSFFERLSSLYGEEHD